jgi:hypothetical protein
MMTKIGRRGRDWLVGSKILFAVFVPGLTMSDIEVITKLDVSTLGTTVPPATVGLYA